MNIIVTGASKGIGFELAKLFSKEKSNTVIAISRNEKLLKTLKKGSENIHIIAFDLESGEKEYKELLNSIQSIFENIDILVNNAGLLINKPFEDLTWSDFDRLFNVNMKSVFALTQTLLPIMKPGSHIINIGSMGGYQGSSKFKGLSLYSSAKGALSIFTECLAEELKDRKIFANCLALGAVQTEMLNQAFPNFKAPITPEEMAQFIADFSISGHQFFNGKTLPVSLSTP